MENAPSLVSRFSQRETKKRIESNDDVFSFSGIFLEGGNIVAHALHGNLESARVLLMSSLKNLH